MKGEVESHQRIEFASFSLDLSYHFSLNPALPPLPSEVQFLFSSFICSLFFNNSLFSFLSFLKFYRKASHNLKWWNESKAAKYSLKSQDSCEGSKNVEMLWQMWEGRIFTVSYSEIDQDPDFCQRKNWSQQQSQPHSDLFCLQIFHYDFPIKLKSTCFSSPP